MSDQKCIYRYTFGKRCLESPGGDHITDYGHEFQPPFEPTDEAVTAGYLVLGGLFTRERIFQVIVAALSVMQKGQDK